MVLDGNELDRIVYDVVQDCSRVRPTREEIAQHVLDHIKMHISDYVVPSIERLVREKRNIEDRDTSRGRPYIYWAAPSSTVVTMPTGPKGEKRHGRRLPSSPYLLGGKETCFNAKMDD